MLGAVIMVESMTTTTINGRNPTLRIIPNHSKFIFPVNMTTLVALLTEIQPHMCNLMGCLACCLTGRAADMLVKIYSTVLLQLNSTLICNYSILKLFFLS